MINQQLLLSDGSLKAANQSTNQSLNHWRCCPDLSPSPLNPITHTLSSLFCLTLFLALYLFILSLSLVLSRFISLPNPFLLFLSFIPYHCHVTLTDYHRHQSSQGSCSSSLLCLFSLCHSVFVSRPSYLVSFQEQLNLFNQTFPWCSRTDQIWTNCVFCVHHMG